MKNKFFKPFIAMIVAFILNVIIFNITFKLYSIASLALYTFVGMFVGWFTAYIFKTAYEQYRKENSK